jgi:hypothetical protein
MVVLNRAKQQTVIWIVAFNDEQGASLFADFYRQVLDRVDGQQDLQGLLDQNNGPAPHDLEQSGNKVLVIAGPGATQFSALAPAIWQATKVSDINPPPPPAAADSDDDQGNAVTRAIDSVRGFVRDWLGFGKQDDPLKYNN